MCDDGRGDSEWQNPSNARQVKATQRNAKAYNNVVIYESENG